MNSQLSPYRGVATGIVAAVALLIHALSAVAQDTAALDALPADAASTKIHWHRSHLDGEFFAEGGTAGDIDGDGFIDVISGPYWYAGPDFAQRYSIYAPAAFDPHGYSDNFFSYVEDLNGNGRLDVLVIGFPGAAAFWFENPGAEEARQSDAVWRRHLALDIVDNESPTFVDLTGDGVREIVCSRQGYFGFARPNRADPTAPWRFVPISDQSAGGRFTHGLGVGDIDGDGRLDILEKSGWWQQPASLEGDPQWHKHPFPFSGPGGAQMLVTDVDGDGLPDVITSLEAHGYGIVWYRQRRQGDRIDFDAYTIVGRTPQESPYGVVFSQPHAMTLADINGDGLPDLVTGKRWWAHGPKGDPEPNAPAVLYWFELQRRPDAIDGPPAAFVPHLIDDASGVGTDLQTHDLTGNGLPDIVVSNKLGTFVHRQVGHETLTGQPAQRALPVASWDAARPAADIHPDGLTAEQARQAMTVPAGFEVDLIAAEPRIHQPVAFTFDARGRLWVAEAHTYPIRAPEGEGADRIVILEDTTGDGRFDRRQVFIEGLNLVSGLEVGFGGVWVGAAPYLLFIPDADGDGVPDGPPQTLLDGWGYQDTHETLNAFNWGPDGWLYGCQGVFTHSRVGRPGTPDEQRIPMNAGVWRYHPVRHRFEVFAHGTSNPWGVDFDDHGQAFITACVIAHAFHIVQGGRYERQAGRHFDPYTFDDLKTIADHRHYAGNIADHAWWGRNEPVYNDATSRAGGGHAHCGAMVYLGDNWPDSYRNSLMMANIHGNRINLERLRPDGSGFIAGHGDDVIFANDAWFRGINLRYGPDGAVYLIDWYDANACHRASPEIWDRSNGRLFRVRFGQIDPMRVNLDTETDAELIERHEHTNDWYVRAARRVLQHRHAAGTAESDRVRGELLARAADAQRPTARRLRYLWTAHAIASLSDDEVRWLLADSDPSLRSWAIQLATDRAEFDDQLDRGQLQLSRWLLSDLVELSRRETSPRVRLYLASLMQRLATADRWQLAPGLVAAADHASDKNISLMTWYGLGPLVPEDPQQALVLAQQSQLPLVRRFLFRRAAVDPRLLSPLVELLAGGLSDELSQEILDELRQGAEQWGRIPSPDRWSEVVERLGGSPQATIRDAVQFLSIAFGDASVFPILRQTASDPSRPLEVRRQALAGLVQGRDQQLLELSLSLLDDPQLRSDTLPLLARFDSPQVAQALIDGYSGWLPEQRKQAMDVFVSRPELAHRLLDALDAERLPAEDLTAVHVSRISKLGDDALVERLGQIWGAVRPTPEAIAQQIETLGGQLTAKRLAEADLVAGRRLYAKSCGQCHMLFGEGGRLGPDLTGADRGNVRYWLENILDPNAVVGKDYQTVTALTDDGRVITGLLRQETDVAIVLEDAEKRVTLPRSEIESLRYTGLSLMPEGLLQGLSEPEIADLIAYLQSPGQVLLPGQLPTLDAGSGRMPGALEGETLEVLKLSGGRVQPQAMGEFKADTWSGQSQLWWLDGQPGDQLTLAVPVAAAGRYEVVVVLTKAIDYGSVALTLNAAEPPVKIDLFHQSGVVTTGPLSLGKHQLPAGQNRLQVTLGVPNPAAVPRNMFGIDYVLLLPAEL